jgi:hypothetical protein
MTCAASASPCRRRRTSLPAVSPPWPASPTRPRSRRLTAAGVAADGDTGGLRTCLEATAHDDALEVLEALLRDLFSNAEKADKKARMRSLKDLDRSAATLAAACKVVLDSSISDDNVRARLFNDLPRTTLEKPWKRSTR